MAKVFIIILSLIILFPGAVLCAGTGKEPSAAGVPGPPPPNMPPEHMEIWRYFDSNNNGVLDPDEAKLFDSERLRIFDKNHNGILDPDEMEAFTRISPLIANGTSDLSGLNEGQKNLYKEWRDALLSANPAMRAPGGAVNQPNIAKCYPDKVCDDHAAPNSKAPVVSSPPPPLMNPGTPVPKNMKNETKSQKH